MSRNSQQSVANFNNYNTQGAEFMTNCCEFYDNMVKSLRQTLQISRHGDILCTTSSYVTSFLTSVQLMSNGVDELS